MVLWRGRGLKQCPKAKALSSTRHAYTASPSPRSPGSEMDARFPRAVACKSTLGLEAQGWCAGVYSCQSMRVYIWVIGQRWAAEAQFLSLHRTLRSSILLTDFLLFPPHAMSEVNRIVDEGMLAKAVCSSLNHLTVINRVIISLPIDFAGKMIEG